MKKNVVYVAITDEQGILLDRFPVCHWRYDLEAAGLDPDIVEQAECVGSPASHSLLVERIARYVTEVAR